MKITDSIFNVGVNDHITDLFESQFEIKNGMSYNSYVIMDEKITIMDTVEEKFKDEWLENIKNIIGDKKPEYLVIHHMEPDHSYNIENFLKIYPDTKVVGNAKTFSMIENFFPKVMIKDKVVVTDSMELVIGKNTLKFIFAPMVHWPEVMLTYLKEEKVIFSADAFGKFGANDVKDNWEDEARRFYYAIVAKYGLQVQNLLKKLVMIEVKKICPLHGTILEDNLEKYIGFYDTWSKCLPEKQGVAIFYTSVYGNTKKCVTIFKAELEKRNTDVVITDLARTDMSKSVMLAYMYPKIVLATTTYNMDIFPFMKDFINHLIDRNFSGRKFAFIENGSWAPNAEKVMKNMIEGLKNITISDNGVHIKSSLSEKNYEEISLLADEFSKND